ncbi:hypothetical protein BJ980_002377 [Nocardioides daedukensis]|uniref:Integral membrane protein n=1 Tax=Nocardioides daedukensis TaxID=634462 RepID=A0A7Y9S4A4_9ACTN|nr:hypothetical protein [Nocardioides daedukensis]NYG59454.1 hypothetical protein [Nocardioides daedukensis]
MSWLFTIVIATYAGVIAALAASVAVTPALAQMEPLVRHGMKVAQIGGALVAVVAGLNLLKGHEPDQLWISVGYAVAVVGVPFLLLTRQPDENGEPVEPASPWVVAIAAITMAVLLIRLQQTW